MVDKEAAARPETVAGGCPLERSVLRAADEPLGLW